MNLKPLFLFSGIGRGVFACAVMMGIAAISSGHAQTYGVSAWASADGIMGETNVLRHRLVANQTGAAGGQNISLAWEFEMQPEWHIYWQNAGDSGLPPQLSLLENPANKKGSILPLSYPAPHVITLAPITNYGYKNKVALGSQFIMPKRASMGPTTLAFKAEFLYCKDVCLPGTASLSLPLTIGTAATNPAFTAPTLPTPWPNAALTATSNGTQAQIELPFAAEGVRFIPNTDGLIDDSATQTAQGNTLTLTLDAATQPTPTLLDGLIIKGTEAWEVKIPLKAGLISTTEAAPPASFWVALVGAFLAGLILNLMPCVLPVLSLKVLGMVKHHHGPQRMQHALAYTAGVVASFWGFAAIIVALKASGATLGWGFHLQSPMVVAALTLLMVAMALNFWGIFSVGNSLTRLGANPKMGKAGHEPLLASAATGVLAVVVATPCTVPFMGAALGYALTQSIAASFVIFTAMGLGLALPFLVIAASPRATRLLPKPGAWMNTFKHALGWPMMLTALWLAYVFQSLTGQVPTFALLLAALMLAFALWIYGQRGTLFRMALIVGLTLGSLMAIHTLTKPTAATPNWQPWSAQAVQAAQANGQPIFVDFTADWCITCKVTEATVLNTAAVQDWFKANNVLLLKADWTARDDAITAELAKHGRQGVPLYLFYTTAKPEPTILPQLLSLGVLQDALGRD